MVEVTHHNSDVTLHQVTIEDMIDLLAAYSSEGLLLLNEPGKEKVYKKLAALNIYFS